MNQNELLESKDHAKCGLYCPACSAYIATREEPERLDVIANRLNLTREDLMCKGCGSEQVSYFCRTCDIKSCANEKGYQGCAECIDMPCDKVLSFQRSGKPHRLEVVNSLNTLKEHGFKEWQEEQFMEYACQKCKTINSAYDLQCRKCRNEPGNLFVERHKEAISKHLATVK
ncbi:MAG: putative redox protein regulator of disulfide bond formation [Clostridiales bacterium]|jgi:ribosomal protein L40E|nr:putative redox protein regulator of disulfide bond formation [Clostridiales bacterium]MDF2595122.1 putative redox protein regulator of disulfide bond formation [Clostridia bacterium]